MKCHFLKINKVYLDAIKNGKKRHEYRLNDLKLSDLSIGDIIILINKENVKDYARVVVSDIKICPNWESALERYWREDFANIHSSLFEVIKECHKFYRKDDVDKFGIKVIGIKIFDNSIDGKTFLLDTNIFIQRENDKNCLKEITLTYSAIEQVKGTKLISNETINELLKHVNKEYKDQMLIKTKAYKCINLDKCIDDYFIKVCNTSGSPNSDIDNLILGQVFMNKVDYLITQDRGILYKASQLFIRPWVLTPTEFLNRFSELHPDLKRYDALSVELKQFADINLDDVFFDTLKKDYGGADFINWFKRKLTDKAYVFYQNNKLQGFLYLKQENKDEKYDDLEPVLSPGKRLKIGTFKVNSTGLRLGERYLKIIFDNAIQNSDDEIYVTLFENKRPEVVALKNLLENWGFVKGGVKKSTGEIYMVKKMNHYDCTKSPKWNYPNIKTDRHFGILPIQMRWHNKLFPDLHVKFHNENIYDLEARSYAIEKVYVCRWASNKLKPGDELLVYMMSDYYKYFKSAMTGIVILQDIHIPTDVDDLIKYCKNISIFSIDELKEFYKTWRNIVAIKVLLFKSFTRKINYATLMETNILDKEKAPPRISTILNLEKYNHIINLSQSISKVEKHEKSNTNINKTPIR